MRMRDVSLPVVAVLSALCCFDATANAQNPVPIKGVGEGVVVSAIPDPDFPFIVDLVVEWEGTGSHLGLFTRTDWLTINFLTGELSGTKTFTAANGDELCVYTEGEFDPDLEPSPEEPLSITGFYVFTGGSGRFEGATGGADFEVITPDFTLGALSFEGEIDY